MDKALKQRLVGASVLVALAVIILPMLLGGGAEDVQDTRQIEIPPRPAELSLEKRRFPIGEQPSDQPSVVPENGDAGAVLGQEASPVQVPEAPERTLQERLEEVAANNSAQAAEAATPPETTDQPSITQLPAESVGQAGASEAAEQDAPPAEEVAATDPPPASEPDPAPETPVAPPPASEPANTPAVPSGASSGRYMVQVASFSSLGNANRLAGSLRESGLPVMMDTVESSAGTLNRVRVGPFEQQAEAEQVLARLGQQMPDVRPRMVDLRPDDETQVTEPNDPLIRWVVQVGVFSSRENAEKLVFSLRDAGFRASSVAETAGGVTRYKVRVGPEVERASAIALKERLETEQGMKGIVQSTE